MGMFMLLPILLLGGGLGGANELLDYVETAAYWKAKNTEPTVAGLVAMIDAAPKAEDISALIKQLGHEDFEKREAASEAIGKKGPGVIPQLKEATKSTDAEVADRANRLISELSGGDTDPAVHKLMIIRTLGEMKDKAALPALKAMASSKDPFVATYVERAIARIEGKELKPVALPAETWEKDVWLLPKGVKIVGQLTMPGGGPVNWGKALDAIAAPAGFQTPKEQVHAEMQKGVLSALNNIGNVRIDGITMGVSGDPGPRSGFLVIFVRGYCNRDKLKTTLKKLNVQVDEEDGVTIASPPNAGMKMILASDDLLVITGGPPGWEFPVKELIKAVKTGKGTVSEDEEVTALIKSADRTTGGWGVAQMTETYKSGGVWLAGYETIVAQRISEKGKTTVKFTGKGKDADKVAASVADLNKNLDMVREQFKAGAAGGFIPKPIIDFIGSIKVESTGNTATMTGSVDADFEAMIGAIMFPMMMMGGPGF